MDNISAKDRHVYANGSTIPASRAGTKPRLCGQCNRWLWDMNESAHHIHCEEGVRTWAPLK